MTTMDGDRAIVLLVELFVHPGRAPELRRSEVAAARIMRRQSGRIDRIIRPIGPPRDAGLPGEIPLGSFAGTDGQA